mmetsp:Transcript_4035/g.9739  ORF Transcript_4035/g.9739 Transcript_4035/m.9739 type:complete len:211 (+) Transcript_4035:447-1079(+)
MRWGLAGVDPGVGHALPLRRRANGAEGGPNGAGVRVRGGDVWSMSGSGLRVRDGEGADSVLLRCNSLTRRFHRKLLVGAVADAMLSRAERARQDEACCFAAASSAPSASASATSTSACTRSLSVRGVDGADEWSIDVFAVVVSEAAQLGGDARPGHVGLEVAHDGGGQGLEVLVGAGRGDDGRVLDRENGPELGELDGGADGGDRVRLLL